ncbi:hypothetical protein V8E54_010972 [Elaphomyces granulatus]
MVDRPTRRTLNLRAAAKNLVRALAGRWHLRARASTGISILNFRTPKYCLLCPAAPTNVQVAITSSLNAITNNVLATASPPSDDGLSLELLTACTSDDTNSSVNFEDNLVYAVSSIRYIREHAPTIVRIRDERRKKHLHLVDAIALLLVTEDKTDVAAALPQCRFDRPCTPEETTYIKSLVETIQNFDLSKQHEVTWTIVEMAVRMCIKKVHYRIRKISKELQNFENLENPKIWQNTRGRPASRSVDLKRAWRRELFMVAAT